MESKLSVYGEYFYGNKISEYGLRNGFVDYATLAKAFDAVLNNDIICKTEGLGYWEQVSGFDSEDDEDEDYYYSLDCVYQLYIVSESGAKILQDANQIVYYNDELNMYVWGVTHFGTSWDYVLTDIPCNTHKDI